jgi:phage tail-like protein
VLIGGAAAGLGLAATALDAVLPQEAEAQSAEVPFFALEIEGESLGHFSEVSGLGSEHEVIERGGRTQIIKKIPGRLKWGDIILKRGMTADLDFFDWRKLVEDGQMDLARKNGSVVALDASGHEVARWNFVNGWPSKYHVGTLDTRPGEGTWEVVTLAVEVIGRVLPDR